MEFSYQTRKKYAERKLDEWKKTQPLKRMTLSAQQKNLLETIINTGSWNRPDASNYVEFWEKNQRGENLSVFMKKNCKGLVDLFVPKGYEADYYALVDEIIHYRYTTGASRRTLRTGEIRVHVAHAFELLYSYMVFGTYKVSLSDYIKGNMDEEAKDYAKNDGVYGCFALHQRHFDEILATRLNAGDRELTETIKEAFLSDNNTVIVTTDIISAVIKAKNPDLHELLAGFLVAARLQEGVRQAICEAADCGRTECFLLLLKTIKEENLLRFAAVKRAVSTWVGICDEANMERINDKVFEAICRCVNDRTEALKSASSNDSVEIVIGLWALGFYEVKDAIDMMKKLAENGTRNQHLTISYYNRFIQDRYLAGCIATYMVEQYADDLAVVAAFMPTYMAHTGKCVQNSFKTDSNHSLYDEENATFYYHKIPVNYFFKDNETSGRHYYILKKIALSMKKKKQEYAPCIFPWYGVVLEKSDLVSRMSMIAYILQDNDLIDDVCEMLSDIDGTYSERRFHIRMLLHNPQTDLQRKALISYVADKETYTRKTAYTLVKGMSLTDEEYMQLEEYLKYKSDDIRQKVIGILNNRTREGRVESIKRLLQSSKENVRLAGLDMVKSACEKETDNQMFYKSLVTELIPDKEQLSEPEKILFHEIVKEESNTQVLSKEGYGLYRLSDRVEYPAWVYEEEKKAKHQPKLVADYFSLSEKELDQLFLALDDFIGVHEKDEYMNTRGEMCLLGNGLSYKKQDDSVGRKINQLSIVECYPFPELWDEFYHKYIKSEKNFWNMYIAQLPGLFETKIENYDLYKKAEKALFPHCGSEYQKPSFKHIPKADYWNSMVFTILHIIKVQQKISLPQEIVIQACLYAAALPRNMQWFPVKIDKSRYYYSSAATHESFAKTSKFLYIKTELGQQSDIWENPEIFEKVFYVLHRMDESFAFQDYANKQSYSYRNSDNFLSMYHFIKACEMGLVTKADVYRYAFEVLGIKTAIAELSVFFKDKLLPVDVNSLKKFVPIDQEKNCFDPALPFAVIGKEIYQNIVDTILNVELKRGDTATVFSEAVKRIDRIYGLSRLMEILVALGKETLDRNSYYYYGNGTGKRECLSHLLHVCYPLKTDTAKQLGEEVAKKKISKDRLIEVAMYSPQWLDIIEEYLGYEGFKSGCYYFMAHMNERFDDQKKAMIAKYTPLTSEELNEGCFDVDWFYEAHEKLGDALFGKLYKAAKYISDGSKHTRARKYADAALELITREELETQIAEKRNKDLLMSYGVLPIKDEADELHRYQFLQKFLKESKQFGAQRRASESKCVEVAMKNLATTAGYADVLRLTLAMETALVSDSKSLFEDYQIGEFTLRIEVDSHGKVELIIEKDKKALKSVPASIKKDENYLLRKDFVTKLRQQYSRCVKMFEKGMEDREVYAFAELQKLCTNPVTKVVLEGLLFVDECGNINILEELLERCRAAATKLRIAHPYVLYASGKWAEWQRFYFTRQQQTGKKQPFKQVFRELYVKLPEEMEMAESRIFAGNQIQPAKTVAILKNRLWVADYEDGLQKIYYKDNIIATIYALADWFSPADVEAPTLEYVAFYDRKTFQPLKIKDIPDIVYSEVMRDVDLAVSVAHAGSVDPLTSHSTIEMRSVIVKFNLELFKLDNVVLKDNHAIIDGSLGKYSIHLGSGVIHQLGGHQINVLPVHSAGRGKIFLPFVDDDPKTAEIMSKILLFAQDHKIKDPYIMEQIC